MRSALLPQLSDPAVRRLRLVGFGLLCGLVLWCAAHVLPNAFAADGGDDPQPNPYCLMPS